jgi:hypothetical protein
MNFLAVMIMFKVTDSSISFSGIDVLALSFLQTFIYLMFALLLATFFRRSGVAIIVFFIYGLILEWLLVWMLEKLTPGAGFFLPLQVADSLVTFPKMERMFKSLPGLQYILPAALAFAGAYIFLTVRKYKHDDL